MKFTTLLKKIIIETSEKIDFLIDTYTKSKKKKDGSKKKPKMSKKELFAIIEADPDTNLRGVELESATNEDLKKIKVGDNVNWLIKNFMLLNQTTETPFGEPGYERELERNKATFLEDLYKVNEDLKKFDRFKSKLPVEKRDINKISSLIELYNLVKDFDLTLVTTTKTERKTATVHPGAKLIYDSPSLRVVQVTDKGALGKEAACFYGGNQKETRWCTSAPGLSHFDYYIGKGPLYVIYNPSDPNVSPMTGLPKERYQVSFETDQYMDKDDIRFDIVDKLNGPWQELKPLFKERFAQGLTTNGTTLNIDNFRSGNVGKFVALYGLDELFNSLPDTLEDLSIQNKDSRSETKIDLKIPSTISKFKNLRMLLLDNCISSIPDEVCKLDNLTFIALMNNPNLKSIPDCLLDLPNLVFINLRGSDNVEISSKMKDKAKDLGGGMWDLQEVS